MVLQDIVRASGEQQAILVGDWVREGKPLSLFKDDDGFHCLLSEGYEHVHLVYPNPESVPFVPADVKLNGQLLNHLDVLDCTTEVR